MESSTILIRQFLMHPQHIFAELTHGFQAVLIIGNLAQLLPKTDIQ
jgi:hypothetical protein